jgi:hypothetical protein
MKSLLRCDMSAVAKEIIFMKVNDNDTIADLRNRFFDIMRKHGIKDGTKREDGSIIGANFEWTMCESLFFQTIHDQLRLELMLVCSTPEELMY